jgi:hypothetical protein
MISIASILRKHAEKCNISREAFLPSHGYESLMNVRRPELKDSPGSKQQAPSMPGSPEPIKPGEIIEVYENGKWVKIE